MATSLLRPHYSASRTKAQSIIFLLKKKNLLLDSLSPRQYDELLWPNNDRIDEVSLYFIEQREVLPLRFAKLVTAS